MRARAAITIGTLLVCPGSLAGCAGFASGPNASTSSEPTPIAQAQRTHEYPGAAPSQTAASGASSPVVAIEAFATAYINWSYRTISTTMRALSAISIGQARSETLLAAAQTAQDYELRRGGISNVGVVEAIAPVSDRPNEYAVITREQTVATATSAYQGLQPAWHLALATVTLLRPDQWVISAWSPEN